MLKRIFGPKHTFKDALLILEEGLRSGEITLENGGTPVNGSVAQVSNLCEATQAEAHKLETCATDPLTASARESR